MTLFHIDNTPLRLIVHICGKKFISINKKTFKNINIDYSNPLKRIKSKYGKEKIKVGFLVNEQAKWQYQSVYDEFEKSQEFEPIILVTQMTIEHYGILHYYKSILDCYKSFLDLGLRVKLAYDINNKRFIPISEFDIDIIFYQQPWEIHDLYSPIYLSTHVLTCYTTYGMDLTWYVSSYTKNFHSFIWKIFVENDWIITYFKKIYKSNITNCYPVGYAKLDNYFHDNLHIYNNKKIIIYAPHHSFDKNSLQCGTFYRTGKEMLNFANKHKNEIYWIFKPHPRFKTSVILNNIMSLQSINKYYDEWNKLGQIYEGGDYISIFKQSSAIITDSISFLGEYLPSGNPIFQFINNYNIFNDFGKKIISTCYQAKNVSDMSIIFERVIFKNDDFLKNERTTICNTIFDPKIRTSEKIIKIINNSLK